MLPPGQHGAPGHRLCVLAVRLSHRASVSKHGVEGAVRTWMTRAVGSRGRGVDQTTGTLSESSQQLCWVLCLGRPQPLRAELPQELCWELSCLTTSPDRETLPRMKPSSTTRGLASPHRSMAPLGMGISKSFHTTLTQHIPGPGEA